MTKRRWQWQQMAYHLHYCWSVAFSLFDPHNLQRKNTENSKDARTSFSVNILRNTLPFHWTVLVRYVPWQGFLNCISILKQCLLLPLIGSKYYLMYTFKAIHVFEILDPGKSLEQAHVHKCALHNPSYQRQPSCNYCQWRQRWWQWWQCW